MMRQAVLAVLVAVCSSATVSADLRYTMAVTARPSSAPPAAPANPFLNLIAPIIVGLVAPGGSLETRATIGENGARFEYNKPFAMVPAGGAMIVRSDGSVLVINPAEKTYFRIGSAADASGAQPPEVTVERSGTFETIAGVRAERATISVRAVLPLADAAPGLPKDVSFTGETWLADSYGKYAAMALALGPALGAPGQNPLAGAGFPMRSILRGDLFGSQEIESVVTSINEGPAPAGVYDIPAGFTEVDPPRGGLPGLGAPAAR